MVGHGGAGGRGQDAGSAEQQDTGFWDLVYILYADFAEAAGVATLRGLVPHWALLEKTLMVSMQLKERLMLELESCFSGLLHVRVFTMQKKPELCCKVPCGQPPV